MNPETEIIDRERQFWTGSEAYYGRWLAGEVLMIFPAPVGTLKRDEILLGLRSGSRWTSIEMTDISFCQLDPSSACVLAYRARARKPDSAADYVALIGSVYVLEAGEWKLAFHQHTPMQEANNT